MFKKMMLVAGLVAMLALSGCSYQKVEAGNVGVKVYLLGQSKGVDSEVVGVGRYWLTWNEDLYLFPTFTQNYTWTGKGSNRGDQSITFQTNQGLSVNADVGISYRIEPSKVSVVFQKYRKGVDEITDIYLRNMVQDSLNKRAGKLPIESVYGDGKTELIEQVQHDVVAQVQDIGILIEKIYWIGEIRLPPSVKDSLNKKIEATQKAQQRENEVAQAKAEADKAIEEARGVAESKTIVAKAEAEAIRIKGDALRQNQELVQLTIAERWNGQLPTVTGGNTPLLDLRNMTK